MYIHRDSRQESEMSPHAQRQLRLWILVAPASIGKYVTLIQISHV